MPKIIVFATTDLVSDQRVHRTSFSLHKEGYEVLAVGRRLKTTPKTISKEYRIKLYRMLFKKGPLFYFFYNLRSFFFLLFARFDLACSNDTDSLLGCWLGCTIRRKPIVFDSHELFPEMPELIGRPFPRKVWIMIERICLKGIKYSYTVSQGIADECRKRYGINMEIIRNYPLKNENYGHKSSQPTIIYQGALNKGRGIELAIEMMKHLPCYKLVIAGTGDIEIQLRKQVIDNNLLERIEFKGRVNHEELHELTSKAWLGLSLEENICLSYYYALPNKLFDYVQAQTPVLVSDLPEMSNVVSSYGVGIVASLRNPKDIADQIMNFFEDKEGQEMVKQNLKVASCNLVWEEEEPRMLDIYRRALNHIS